MRLEELIAGANAVMGAGSGARIVSGDASMRVCDLTEDSRTVLPGSLFVARAGTKADGREFVQQALRAGASAVLCQRGSGVTGAGGPDGPAAIVEALDVALASAVIAERFYGDPSRRLRCVGVTGTNGKTTTTWLTWRLLNGVGIRTGLIGTVMIDDGVELARAEMTTPPAIELSRTLGVMVENGCRVAAMEVSSHSLAQKRVAGLRFEIGVFTNLTQDHLDYHKTMGAYADAKAKLFESLAPEGLAIVNRGDGASGRMLRDCRSRVLECAEVKAGRKMPRGGAAVQIMAMDREGMKLHLRGPWGDLKVRVGLIGSFNAMNVLQAVACAHECGMSVRQIAAGCEELDAPPGRLERVKTRVGEPLVLVDFAHTEDGLRNALGTVRRVLGTGKRKKGRLIALFGCGGDKDKSKRPKMGAVASELADVAVLTSDNPRSEDPMAIIAQVREGIDPANLSKVMVQADRSLAIHQAISRAKPNDIVVLAGKGHETEQILPDGSGGTVTNHFDDREVAKQALAERRADERKMKAKARVRSGAKVRKKTGSRMKVGR